MIITDVRATQPIPADMPGDWRGTMGQIVVAVDTDDGRTGYGIGGGGAAATHVIETELRRVLLGADANDVEGLWEAMYRATLAYGRKGLAIMAISGVDLALWDLRGKAADRSVARLLAETPATEVSAYRTTSLTADDLEAGVRQALDEGYRAVKLGSLGRYALPDDAGGLVDAVRAVRALIGDEVELMADAAMAWDNPRAVLDLTEALADTGLTWLEEPLPADDLAGYAWLAKRSPIPIAGGEHEYTARGFAELRAGGCHHVWQPDICWCGGMTQLVEIYRLAGEHDIRVVPHRGSEVYGLHAVLALPTTRPLAESGRPWMEWVGGRRIDAGRARLQADAPGFGVDLSACF
jgi:L-rhamnonate dehydratase